MCKTVQINFEYQKINYVKFFINRKLNFEWAWILVEWILPLEWNYTCLFGEWIHIHILKCAGYFMRNAILFSLHPHEKWEVSHLSNGIVCTFYNFSSIRMLWNINRKNATIRISYLILPLQLFAWSYKKFHRKIFLADEAFLEHSAVECILWNEFSLNERPENGNKCQLYHMRLCEFTIFRYYIL